MVIQGVPKFKLLITWLRENRLSFGRNISYLVQKWTVSDIQSIHLSPEFWTEFFTIKWIKGMLYGAFDLEI